MLARLCAALDEPWTLTLVTAPAGAGKTRLLSHWAHDLVAEADIEVAWVSFQRGDADLSRLRASLEQINDENLRAIFANFGDASSAAEAKLLARALRVTVRRIVLRIVVLALTRKSTLRQIAQQEFVSPNTVNTHVRNIYRKLGVSDRDGVTAAAHALGIR